MEFESVEETERNARAEKRLLQAHRRHLLTFKHMLSGYILVPTRAAFSARENAEKTASTELINMGLVPGKYHDLPYFHGSVRSDGSIFLSQQSSNATEELLVALVTIGHVLKGRAIVRDEYSEVEHFNVSLCFQ